MPRAYSLGQRAGRKQATRQRILDVARELLIDDRAQIAMEAIARRAGVTRATVYLQFGSRRELFLAVLNDALDRADVRDVRKGLQHRDPATAARLMLRGSCRFWASEYPIFKRVKSLAAVDPVIAELDRLKEGVREGHITNLVSRLADAGQLKPGLTARRARLLLLMLSSFEVFEQLHIGGKLGADAVAGELIAMADARVLALAGERQPQHDRAATA
jgi:AcrR family transcriptional regulator